MSWPSSPTNLIYISIIIVNDKRTDFSLTVLPRLEAHALVHEFVRRMRLYLEVKAHALLSEDPRAFRRFFCSFVVSSMSSRKSYTLDFKRRVLLSLEANEGNISQTARQHSIHRRLIQRWARQSKSLEEIAESRDVSVKKRRRLKRKSSGGLSAKFPELEKELLAWVVERREEPVTVDGEAIKHKARQLYESLYGKNAEETSPFKASNRWLGRFSKRHRLTSRCVTSQEKKIPENAKDLAEKFLDDCKEAFTETQSLNCIGNMDETPLWFDRPRKRTVDFRGIKTVLSKTTGKEKLRYTVVLAALANGTKLPPMIIFKGLKKVPKGTFPKDVVIEVAKGGSMTTDLLISWFSRV